MAKGEYTAKLSALRFTANSFGELGGGSGPANLRFTVIGALGDAKPHITLEIDLATLALPGISPVRMTALGLKAAIATLQSALSQVEERLSKERDFRAVEGGSEVGNG